MKLKLVKLLPVATLLIATPVLANKLLAPAYPGAVADPLASAQSNTQNVFLSHSSLATVRAWYLKRFAKESAGACTDRDSGCGQFKQQCETATRTDNMTKCSDFMILKWNAIPPGGSMVDAYNAGIHLSGWQKAAASQASDNANTDTPQMSGQMAKMMQQLDALSKQVQAAGQTAASDARQKGDEVNINVNAVGAIPDIPFAGLKQEVLAGRHSQKQLETVYHRYRNLETSVYPMVKGKNGPVAYNKYEFYTCRSKLMTESVFLPGTQGTDRWDAWLSCLKKISAHAYQTRIVINPGS